MIQRGFTLIEMVVVLGIITILFSLSIPQLFQLRDQNTLQSTHTQLVAAVRRQQLRAMNELITAGVHFDQSKYVLFDGPVYSAGAPANRQYMLDYPLGFSAINLPSSEIIFASGSGEVIAYDTNNRSIILEDSIRHEQKIVRFNSFGIPVEE